jgi:hypothetical protein
VSNRGKLTEVDQVSARVGQLNATGFVLLDSNIVNLARSGSAIDRREQADLAAAIAMSVASTSEGSSAAATLQQPPPPPPPATIYPPLLGTLAATTATSVSQDSTLGNKHTTTPSKSPVSSVRVHSTERVNNQQMTNEQPATHAVLEDISYCSTYPRKDGISNSAVATGNRVSAGGIVSEIESFTSSSIVHQTISDQNIIQQSRHILDHSTDTSMHGDVVLSLPDSQDESRGQCTHTRSGHVG